MTEDWHDTCTALSRKSHFSRKSKTSSSKIKSVFQLCRLPFKRKPNNLFETRSDFDILLHKKKKAKQTLPITNQLSIISQYFTVTRYRYYRYRIQRPY